MHGRIHVVVPLSFVRHVGSLSNKTARKAACRYLQLILTTDSHPARSIMPCQRRLLAVITKLGATNLDFFHFIAASSFLWPSLHAFIFSVFFALSLALFFQSSSFALYRPFFLTLSVSSSVPLVGLASCTVHPYRL